MRWTAVLIVLVALAALSRPSSVRAANFAVTNVNDCNTNGCGSLRDAITQSNAAPGSNTITFAGAAASGVVHVANTPGTTNVALPIITTNLTINGPGAASLTVLFENIANNQGFNVGNGVNFAITGLTVMGGQGGAGINAPGPNGSLTLTDAVVDHFTAPLGVGGGGIVSGVATTLTRVTASNNSASLSGGNGVRLTGTASSTIDQSTITGNSGAITGGGLYVLFGNVTVTNSTISNNNVTVGQGAIGFDAGAGGGIYVDRGTLVLKNSIVSGNNAIGAPTPFFVGLPASLTGRGGGIYINVGSATIDGTTISGNSATYQGTPPNSSHGSGGGVYFRGGIVPFTMTNSTVLNNLALNNGGGMVAEFAPQVTIANDTISGNGTLNGQGGGFYDYANLTNVTLYGNFAPAGNGGNIFSHSVTIGRVINSVFAYSLSGGDCAGAFLSNGGNLSSDNTCGPSVLLQLSTATAPDYVGIDPQLAPLANNGGATQTHLPANTSPLLNHGTNAGCPATDQRGVTRPQNNVCDIGAVEVTLASTTAPAFTSAASTTFLVGAPGSFLVTTAGIPSPVITSSGALPAGVTFVDNGNGTATLAGTPAVGTEGTYALTFTAANGAVPSATQAFTLTVGAACSVLSKSCLPGQPQPPAKPPVISASLAPVGVPPAGKGIPVIPAGSNLDLTFTITNPNATALTGVRFITTLQPGVTISGNFNGSCGSIVPSGQTITLTGATIPGGGSCTWTGRLLTSAPGPVTVTTTPVTSNEGGTGNAASASITLG